MPKKKPASFESSLEQLEKLVEQMDNGELSLEDSLAAFEKGVSLIRDCQSALDKAEQKVSLLMEQNGELVDVDFETEDDD